MVVRRACRVRIRAVFGVVRRVSRLVLAVGGVVRRRYGWCRIGGRTRVCRAVSLGLIVRILWFGRTVAVLSLVDAPRAGCVHVGGGGSAAIPVARAVAVAVPGVVRGAVRGPVDVPALIDVDGRRRRRRKVQDRSAADNDVLLLERRPFVVSGRTVVAAVVLSARVLLAGRAGGVILWRVRIAARVVAVVVGLVGVAGGRTGHGRIVRRVVVDGRLRLIVRHADKHR